MKLRTPMMKILMNNRIFPLINPHLKRNRKRKNFRKTLFHKKKNLNKKAFLVLQRSPKKEEVQAVRKTKKVRETVQIKIVYRKQKWKKAR